MAFSAPSAMRADYSYIISGYPAENPSQSASSVSQAVAFSDARTAKSSLLSALESRFRTILASAGIDFRSDPVKGLVVLFR